MSSWTGYRPWTGHTELDLIELGRRVTCAYDEPAAVAARIGVAIGLHRGAIPLDWQHVITRVGLVSRYVSSGGTDRTLHS